jgi:hypothetical protein
VWIIAGLARRIMPPRTVPASTTHGYLVFALGSVRVGFSVADVHMRRPALPARRAVAEVKVDQVQAAQFADPEAAVGQPGDGQPVPRQREVLRQTLPGAFRWHLWVPAIRPCWSERVRRERRHRMSEEHPASIRPGW